MYFINYNLSNTKYSNNQMSFENFQGEKFSKKFVIVK